jgi:hypothetical protein
VQLGSALSALLQRLPSLLTLSLGLSQASEAALTQLSSLRQLQSCSLKGPCVTPRVPAQLTSSLTYLSLQKRDAVLCEQDLPAAGWPHLKQLKLAHIRIQPTLLSRFTTLERLQLFGGRLLAYSANVSGLLLAWGGCVCALLYTVYDTMLHRPVAALYGGASCQYLNVCKQLCRGGQASVHQLL